MKTEDAGAGGRATGGDAGRRWGLKTYFAGLALMCVAVALAGVVYVSAQSAHDGRTQAARDAQHAAGLAAKQVGDGVKLLQGTAAQLAATPNIADVFERPQDCSLSFAGPAGVTSGHIDVLDRSGRVACSSRPAAKGADPVTYRGADWFAAAPKRPVVAGPVQDPATGSHALVTSAPFDGGVVAGFLALEPAGPELAALFGGGRAAELLIVSRADRLIVARSLDAERWVGQTLPAAAAPSGSGLAATPDVDRVSRIYRAARVPGTDWQVWIGNDEAAALASAHTLRDRQLVIIGAGLALLLAMIALVYRRVARPVSMLNLRVQAASPARLEPVPVEGPREIAELAGSVNGFIASIQEQLAQRAAAEAAARTAAANYQQLFDQSPLPMWIHDGATDEMLAVNTAALRTYGYSRSAFLALGKGDVQVAPDQHRRYDDTPLEVRTFEHDVRFGGRDARLVIAEDVGELERLQRQIAQGQRMEAIGRVAGGIAHDFNNLLAAIVGYSELQLHQLDDASPTWAEAQEIKGAAERGVGLTRQLLAFARGQEVKAEVLDPGEVLRDLLPLLRQLLPPTVAIHTAFDPDAGLVEADRGQLEQVITNLAVNAGHAMPSGGELSLATRATTLPGPSPRGAAAIEVRDTGAGMDEDTLHHIFEPFFTTRDAGEGTGLGLATVYRIVERSHGEIDVSSAPGAGTTFTVTLPTSAGSRSAAQEPSPAEVRQRRRVLLVDDDDAVRTVVRRMLELHGFELLEAASGDQALAMSDTQPQDELDLIVTDSVLPGPGGLELARLVQHRHPGIRVLIMSGYGAADATGKAAPSDASFIAKPFTRDQLDACLSAFDGLDDAS